MSGTKIIFEWLFISPIYEKEWQKICKRKKYSKKPACFAIKYLIQSCGSRFSFDTLKLGHN